MSVTQTGCDKFKILFGNFVVVIIPYMLTWPNLIIEKSLILRFRRNKLKN